MDDETIKIRIVDGSGKEKKISVKKSDSIRTAKEKADCKNYRWRIDGDILKDDKTIGFYEIENDDVISKGEYVEGGKIQ